MNPQRSFSLLALFLLFLAIPAYAERKEPLQGTPVDQLKNKAKKDGTLRVIVGVRLTEDEQKLGKKEAASKAVKQKFFKRHPSIAAARGHDYEFIPFFATDIDSRKLDELLADDHS